MSEARELLEFFSTAKNGEAVMDGCGQVWRFAYGYWHGGTVAHPVRVEPLVLARALCPDLADEMTELG